MQSRYYNPRTGRFLNADAYTSTGQGILGGNMFAYCGNNPVMRFDACGYAWKDIREKLLDYYDRVVGIQQQQQALDTQIRIEQIETVKEATTDLWDAYVHSNELAVERQHQQHMMVRDFVYGEIESWKDDPERAMDFAVITAGNASAYYSYVLFVANPTVGAGIFLVAGVVGGIWATLQHFK